MSFFHSQHLVFYAIFTLYFSYSISTSDGFTSFCAFTRSLLLNTDKPIITQTAITTATILFINLFILYELPFRLLLHLYFCPIYDNTSPDFFISEDCTIFLENIKFYHAFSSSDILSVYSSVITHPRFLFITM